VTRVRSAVGLQVLFLLGALLYVLSVVASAPGATA
jgi:hypothetical protein